MELSMASRRAITKTQAVRYRAATRAGKSQILDLVCAVTGFNRDYARRAFRQALKPRVVRPRTPRPPKYDDRVVIALERCWAVVDMRQRGPRVDSSSTHRWAWCLGRVVTHECPSELR